ncbi:MAG: hypothetical protein Q7R61_01380 [bacterium]|nr:hypothetical protein [bacterium]
MKLFKSIFKFFTGRWYALYISGHGSSFRREGGLMTKKVAIYEADRWIGEGCTIGGASEVRNIFTSKLIYS